MWGEYQGARLQTHFACAANDRPPQPFQIAGDFLREEVLWVTVDVFGIYAYKYVAVVLLTLNGAARTLCSRPFLRRFVSLRD